MATTNETRTNLADRLLARVDNTRRIGSGSRMFRRFGVENPYAGGSVSDTSRGEGLFSFLSSRAYFDELRGLSRMRRHLMWRIASVRHQARVGERMHQNIATRAVRASVFGSPTFIDWGSQIDLEEEQDEAPVVKRRRRPKARRVTAAERALRADVARASDVLAKLGEVFDTMGVVGDRTTTNETRALSRLPLTKQAGAARRIVRKLRGAAAAAARGTDLGLGVESVGQRPLAVAQARQADDRPSKGLRRVLQDSPIVMTLERPETVAPVPAEPAVEREVRRPRVRRPHAHRRVPVATVAREARNQASVGRAGPPEASAPIRSEPPRVAPRPTERIARVATQVAHTPFADVRRGLDAAGRTSPVRSTTRHARSSAFSPTHRPPVASAAPTSARQGPAERVASRAAAGLPDDGGRLTAITSYVGEHPITSQQSERRVSVAPEMALPAPVVSGVSPDSEQTSSVAPSARPVRRRKARGRPSKRAVRGSLPPMARAVQRTVPSSTPGVPMPLAAAPVASSKGIDRRAFAARPVAAIARRAEVGPAAPSMLLAQAAPEAIEGTIESKGTPQSRGATARTRPSSQRALASRRPSRRARALPTVRAAARALAQERTGARGRMLSPSTSAHVRVSNARDALAPALRIESGRIRPVFRSTVASGASIGDQTDAAQSVASPRASRGLPLPELESLATPQVDDATEPAPEVARLGPVARASRRSKRRERVTSTGSLVTEKPVAAFSTSQLPTRRRTLAERVLAQALAGEVSSSTPAARLTSTPAARLTSTPAARLTSTPARPTSPRSVTGTIGVAPAGSAKGEVKRSVVPAVTQVLAQSPRPASASEVLRDPPRPRRGLAARATDRTPRRQRVRRSMLPATTPERQRSERAREKAQLTRAQDEAFKLQRTIVSKARAGEIARIQAVRGVASRASVSESSRTPASQTEISKGVRTPSQETPVSRTVRTAAGWTERTLASRTLPGFTVRSEAFHTGKSQTEHSVTHRTGAPGLERSSLYRAGRRLDAVATLQHAAEVDELPLPMEGGISRAVRRSIPSRTSVSDSPVTYLASTPELLEAGGVAGMRRRRTRVARPVSRAVARSMPRRTAGSVVPHPATTDRAAQATTRMLGAAPGAYAAHEGVVLAGTEAVEYRDPVRSRLPVAARRATAAVARTAPQTSRAGTDRQQARSMEGPEDGMIFATPAPPPEATTIAGGPRSVGPRPGTRSRSRMARALRVATASVTAGQRSSETVLTLPASRRIAEGTATAPRVFEARLKVDSRGRVVRSAIADSTGGPSLLGAVPLTREVATATEWAETREDVLDTERSTRARSKRSRVTLAEDGRSFVPTLPSGTAGSATHNPHLGLGRTLDALSGGQQSPRVRNKPLLRRRAWARRGMAAELGVLAPVLADADYVEGPTVPGDAPSWARRAVIGTSGVAAPRAEALVGETQGAHQRHTTKRGDVQKREERRPNSLSSALARADSPADLVKIILERSDEASTLRKELPARAARMVERIANMPDELAEVLQSGRRTYDTPVAQGLERNVLVPYRSSGVSGPTQLSGAKDGVGANRMMKLADKLRGLIHLAENSRKAAQDNVRMSTEAPSDLTSEGGSGGGGLSVDGHKFGDFEEAVNIIRRSVEDAESDRKERAGETPEGSSPYGT